MGYSKEFEGLTVGGAVFDSVWKDLAKDPQFEIDQHAFIKRTHFDPQLEHLHKNGILYHARGKAVHDAIWSTSVQFGPKTSLIIKAIRETEKEPNTLTDEEIITTIQDYKIKYNNQLFRSSSEAVRFSTLNRARNEKTSLLALLKKEIEENEVKK